MKIKNLSKIYKNKYYEVKALDNINIDFGKTGFVFILGESGSGKSTLLNMIAGIDKPTNGSILVGDKDITNFSNSELDKYRNNYISLVFQEYNLIPELNVIDNINLAVNDIDKSNEALKLVGLENYKERKIYELSGGQKQRVAIAGILAMNCEIIILDEATSMLDPEGTSDIINLINELHTKYNKTIITITHDLNLASLSDNIIVLKEGKVICEGTPDKIFNERDILLSSNLDMPFSLKAYYEASIDDNLKNNKEVMDLLWEYHLKK